MMRKQFTLSIFTENSPGVLQRITIMFTRRKLNIDSLTVSETERKGVSRFTLVLQVEDGLMRIIARQLRRIVEVLHVDLYEDDEIIAKELAFIRVEPSSEDDQRKIRSIVENTGAIFLRDESANMVIQCAGSREVTDKLVEALTEFRVTEFVRSGCIAIPKVGVMHDEAIRLAV